MRNLSRTLCVVIGCLLLAGMVLAFMVGFFGLTVFIPGTDTMAPLILGPSPSGGKADVALLRTRFQHSDLQVGDVVWARFPYKGQTIDVLRVVAAKPGDQLPQVLEKDGIERVPKDYFVLLAANTNGVDSREVGFVEAKDIHGKVVCVLPIGKLTRN